MPIVSRGLPERPHLDVPKREARELLDAFRAKNPDATDRVRGRHPRFRGADDATIAATTFRLSDAQLILAREYGFSSWPELKRRIELNPHAHALDAAIRAGDREHVVQILREHPALLHIPVRSGNWGPPMSHAANLGRLEIIQAIAELGAHDFQHAFDRALLQGKIECARWLHARGATLAPGIVMGACETLNPDGLRFLAGLGAPFTNEHGDKLAPLAMILGTYCRRPADKHECLDILAQQGCVFPDSPIMAFHRGRIDRLREFLARDPALIARRFAYSEIYPTELGCPNDGRSSMHGTPIDGATLLHLAIDFDEREIFDLLLERGADINARATVDAEGFGGHTPLFNGVVGCLRKHAGAMTAALIERGADRDRRANVRKFLDWREKPGWHEALNVTALEWARGFPERGWVNEEAMRILERDA
jgi:hypothetical protein